MNATKWTPGPLKYYRTRYGGFGIVLSASTMVGDAVEIGAAKTELVARLFASAPELVEALEACLRTFERIARPDVDPSEYPILQQVRAALAKAKGEA